MRRLIALVDLSDLLGLLGFAALEYGVYLASVSAAWIVGGCVLMAVAIAPDLRKVKHGPS